MKTRPRPASIVLLAIGLLAPVAFAGDAEVAARARKHLAENAPGAAVEILEFEVLGGSASPDLVELLREAYQKAADQAKAARREDDAAEYLENLTILDRRAPRKSSSSAPTPAPVPAAEPDPLAPPLVAKTAESNAKERLREADAAFRETRYADAGKLYGELAAKGALPENRHDQWAYCRSLVVTQRINAGPRDKAEWDAVYQEISEIKKLSPKTWVGGYLRNLADERAKQAPVVIRGGNPLSDPVDLEKPMPVVAPLVPAPRAQAVPRQPDPVAVDLPRAAGPAEDEQWRVVESENFRVYHHDDKLAAEVVAIAEATRTRQAKRWGGSDPQKWAPRCDIYLFRTADEFAAATKQPKASPGFSTIGINQGRVVQRAVNLRVDHAGMIDNVLTHEVTHVVMADFFRERPIPRWADEGMAVMSEPELEQRKRWMDLQRPLETGRLFKVEDLLSMDSPEARDWPLYYAQSVSLTRFLVESGSPAKFVDFLQGSQRRGIEGELKRIYGIQTTAELQTRWVRYARERLTLADN